MLPCRGYGNTLQIFITVFAMVVTATFDQERQLVGTEMCRNHCAQFYECTFCIFLTKRLTCIAMWSKYPPQTNGEKSIFLNFIKESPGSMSQKTELCAERHSRVVLTRTNDIQCIKVKTEENTQLLIAPYVWRSRTPLRVLHLLNSSITTYHHITPRYVNAMAYVPALRQVLLGVLGAENIRAFSLYTNRSVTIKKTIRVASIAVDDAQQLLFIAAIWPSQCISSMAPNGRYFKTINCDMKAKVLCLDTRRQIVYATDRGRMYSFTYDGQDRQWIASSHNVHGLSLSDNGDVMYYNDNSKIMELELFKNRTRRQLIAPGYRVNNILCNKGYLYVSFLAKTKIHVWYQSSYSPLRGANHGSKTGQLIVLTPEIIE